MEKNGRILIIDDEASFRLMLVTCLSEYGYECQEAADGTEGLNRALDEQWDLILSDITMPGLTGIELVGLLKQYKSDVPVIMISADRKSDSVQSAFRDGAYDFIFKPFELSELEMTIARAREHVRLVRENEQYKRTLEQRVAEQAEKIRTLTLGSILSLARSLEAKDPYTNGHSQRVAEYCVLISQQLKMDHQAQERVHIAGQLHDIGKIGLRESILNKPDRLTDEEYQLVKQHPVIGSEILKPVIMDTCIICGVKHHHERYDGTGYPDRLKGAEIPIEARILSVADTYDAMTTSRAYREAIDCNRVLEELRRCAGTQFDPVVVEAFIGISDHKIETVLKAIPPIQQGICNFMIGQPAKT